MHQKASDFLENFQIPVVKDSDLLAFFLTPDQRHSFVKRMIKKKKLLKLKRGMYYNNNPIFKQNPPDVMLIASFLTGPSYISFETGLAFHGWIPEATKLIQCACFKKKKQFQTAIGDFQYFKVNPKNFYLSVSLEHNRFIASPWRCIADLIYVKKRNWHSIQDLA